MKICKLTLNENTLKINLGKASSRQIEKQKHLFMINKF